MDLITLKNDQLEIKIATLGAELQSIKDNTGKEYLWQGQADIWPRRAPVLFPIVGRLQHNQYALGNQVYSMTQHGFARDREFDVLDKNHQVVTFGLTANQETFEVYPFDFVLKICFTLQNKSLLVTYSVQNRSQQVMPFAIGGHPGFAINYQQDATILKIANPQIIRQLEFTRDNLINQYHSRSIAARLPLKADSFAHDAWVLQSQGFNSYS
ncbi:aldose epimerase family protein, partial [Bombilactobacillus bombi]|uniref:aldose epimerase family protein n=1 Tax=Bombilactobacillus bombi TaxID=1303590 RepID=UPI0015E5A8E6